MLGGGCTFLTTHGLRLGADFCGAISSVGTGDVPMAARLSCALLVCAAASISATFVCGGDVQITHSWDGKSIEGHCDGDYEGAEFMPGDRVPFPDGPLLSGTLPAKLSLNLGIETLWLKNNLISGTIPSEWGGMRTLKELDLSGDRLSGTVPTQLGLLAEMTTLNLFSNRLSGTVPTQLGKLGNLTLRVDGNLLSGTVPPGVSLDAALHPELFPTIASPNSPPISSLPPSTPPGEVEGDSDSGGSRRTGAIFGGILSVTAALLLALFGG